MLVVLTWAEVYWLHVEILVRLHISSHSRCDKSQTVKAFWYSLGVGFWGVRQGRPLYDFSRALSRSFWRTKNHESVCGIHFDLGGSKNMLRHLMVCTTEITTAHHCDATCEGSCGMSHGHGGVQLPTTTTVPITVCEPTMVHCVLQVIFAIFFVVLFSRYCNISPLV